MGGRGKLSSLTMSATEQDDDWGDFLDAGNGGESTVVAETSTVEDTFGTFDGEIFGDAKNNGVEGTKFAQHARKVMNQSKV